MKNFICLNQIQLAYPCLMEKNTFQGEKGRYTCRLVISKNNEEAIARLKAGINDCYQKNLNTFEPVNGAPPRLDELTLPLHDSDDKAYKSELYTDSLYIDCKNKIKPALYNHLGAEITDPSLIYTGVSADAIISFSPYNYNGSQGITPIIHGVMIRESMPQCTPEDFRRLSSPDPDEGILQ